MTGLGVVEPSGTVTTLRGARVEVDVERVGFVAVGICLLALAVTGIVLLVAGIEKNAQITRLRKAGVPVEVTVSGCLGLMGGSGSNLAGYSCKGTYVLEGHRYYHTIPGNTSYRSGTRLAGIAVPDDPGLFSTPRVLKSERSSAREFVLPAFLLLILVLAVVTWILRRRKLRACQAA